MSTMPDSTETKTVLIVGAARGVGYAIAEVATDVMRAGCNLDDLGRTVPW
jgi:NAD(P)-dependent dehydrogenase (short-subunit alcohol dehydrogenase family)